MIQKDYINLETQSYFLCDVIASLSIKERFMLERKLVKIITDKRPYYNTVKKREIIKDALSELLDVIIENGL